MSRILLADDSPHARRMGERILREEGYEVFTVTDGNAALTRLAELDPDVIFADVSLPNRSGYEVCQKVKTHPHFAHIRVVLTAGLLEPFDEAQAAEVRCDGILKKPFESSVVIETVRPLAAAAVLARSAPAPASSVMNEPALVENVALPVSKESGLAAPALEMAPARSVDLERPSSESAMTISGQIAHPSEPPPTQAIVEAGATRSEADPSRIRIETVPEVIVLHAPAVPEATSQPGPSEHAVMTAPVDRTPDHKGEEGPQIPSDIQLKHPTAAEEQAGQKEILTPVILAPEIQNGSQPPREEFSREDRVERLRAAVTLAVNAAVPAVVDQITEKILLALGD